MRATAIVTSRTAEILSPVVKSHWKNTVEKPCLENSIGDLTAESEPNFAQVPARALKLDKDKIQVGVKS